MTVRSPDAVQVGRHHRDLVPIAPNGETKRMTEVSKRKQAKSRNGCANCKARRRKCDETKPACQQCSSRRIECGGYAKGLKWKLVGKLHNVCRGGNRTELTDGCLEVASSLPQPQTTDPLPPGRFESAVEDDGSGLIQATPPHLSQAKLLVRSASSLPSPFNSLNLRATALPRLPKSASPLPSLEYTFEDFDVAAFDPRQLDEDVLSSRSPNLSLHFDDIDLLLSTTAMEVTFNDHTPPQLADELSLRQDKVAKTHQTLGWHIYSPETTVMQSLEAVEEENPEGDEWQLSIFDPMAETSTQILEAPRSSSVPQVGNSALPLYRRPQSPDVTRETIKHLFDLQTCGILSIKDDQSRNPWKTLIWPMASKCPALYHALAAMTCSHLCRSQPELHPPALQHFQRSMRALAVDEDKGTIPLEFALATRLALGFAESWDHQKSSTGIDHINSAKTLVQRAISKHQTSKLIAGELSRLSFLANTWMYMDVIARFTSPDDGRSADFEFMNACSLLSPVPPTQQIDPLMGCAITLFPMMGRLADLVARVRKRTETRNSPAIISTAIDLKIAIERWVPAIDVEGPNSSVSDSIQTAEAYRWAALLLLRQAVPELPWSRSMWELAQKALVFLATIPLTSRTTIVQIFPLMVAGTEAPGEEDRAWVRERWELMSKRMITGIVHRCKKVTAEVWRRRDEYAASRDSCRVCGASMSRDGLEAATAASGAAARTFQTSGCRCSAESRPRSLSPSSSSDFPKSAAFKKGIDLLTRAGSIKYTVKGDLHWLGIMKEWGWEVMLG